MQYEQKMGWSTADFFDDRANVSQKWVVYESDARFEGDRAFIQLLHILLCQVSRMSIVGN